MARGDVEREMEEAFGARLAIFERIPDEFVGAEWYLLKRLAFGETLIPSMYKQLIGLAAAAVSRSAFGVAFHTGMARLNGASDAELAEAVQYAKLAAGWGLYATGLGLEERALGDEVARIVAFLAKRGGGGIDDWPFLRPVTEDGEPGTHDRDHRAGP